MNSYLELRGFQKMPCSVKAVAEIHLPGALLLFYEPSILCSL